jgi:hypothetical protein
MERRSRPLYGIAFLVLAAGLLAGCDSVREASGAGKEPPDEFAVLTKAPLIIPPDYNLRPPQPGAAPTNSVEPTKEAQQTLYAQDPQTVASNMTGSYSQGEKLLLAYAGVQNADPSIRQDLLSDRKSMQGATDSFTDEVLFWKKPETAATDVPVNADAEAGRVSAQQAAGQKVGGSAAAPKADTDTSDNPKDEKKSGGWFDWF